MRYTVTTTDRQEAPLVPEAVPGISVSAFRMFVETHADAIRPAAHVTLLRKDGRAVSDAAMQLAPVDLMAKRPVPEMVALLQKEIRK
jgi:tRNA pseudouridine-54 N-methylase